MTRKETIAILAIMRSTYPRFYPTTQSNEEVNTTIDVWSEMFENDDLDIVKLAIKNLINRLEFPPTIADVRKEIDKISAVATKTLTAEEEWEAIRHAVKNSIYYAKEQYESLPSVAKRFVGSPAQLRDWAMSESFNDGVMRSLFLKQYNTIKDRERVEKQLTPEIIQKITGTQSVLELE